MLRVMGRARDRAAAANIATWGCGTVRAKVKAAVRVKKGIRELCSCIGTHGEALGRVVWECFVQAPTGTRLPF